MMFFKQDTVKKVLDMENCIFISNLEYFYFRSCLKKFIILSVFISLFSNFDSIIKNLIQIFSNGKNENKNIPNLKKRQLFIKLHYFVN